MYCCLVLKNLCERWIRNYDYLQFLAVILLYVQIACSLVGSLGVSYNGLLLTELGIALFALVAIESSSQSLGRTYAVLLIVSILLDVIWLILFSGDIWNLSSQDRGTYYLFSVKLTLAMQIIGFCVRVFSSFLWIQMYRLGVSNVGSSALCDDGADSENLHNCLLTPSSSSLPRQYSDSDVVLGGSVYDPVYYSSLFEYIRHPRSQLQNQCSFSGEHCSPVPNVPHLKLHSETSIDKIEEEEEVKQECV